MSVKFTKKDMGDYERVIEGQKEIRQSEHNIGCITVTLKGTDEFKDILKLVERMLLDERISYRIRAEYMEEWQKIGNENKDN